VFLISVFDSATAARCPDPLLPVSEGVQWHPSTSNQARQTVAGETSASFGSGSFGGWTATDTAITLSQRDHKGSMTMVVGSLAARDYKGVGNQYVDEGKVMAVAIPIHDQATRFAGKRGNKQDGKGNGLGIGSEGDPMNTLTSTDRHAVVQYDGYNQPLYEDDVSVTIRIGRDSSDFIAQPAQTTMAVRRLTPLECERLMGWPDGWTATKADGTPQSDTHRYKQCGNGIASPVAQWIAQQLLQLTKDTHETPTTITT
jgi:site-specific DNA-cytosine methylase